MCRYDGLAPIKIRRLEWETKKMKNEQKGSLDFMLVEYQHHLDEFRRNEELGESRVNLFLTIVTVVFTGGAFAFINKMSDKQGYSLPNIAIYLVIISAFGITALFGYLTLLRLVHRNLASSEELRASGRIKRFFVDRDPRILEYLYYKPFDNKPKRSVRWSKNNPFGRGGLVETVMVINVLLVIIPVIIFFVLVVPYFESVTKWALWPVVLICIIICIIIGLFAWKRQSNFVDKKYKGEEINYKFPEPRS